VDARQHEHDDGRLALKWIVVLVFHQFATFSSLLHMQRMFDLSLFTAHHDPLCMRLDLTSMTRTAAL
jgi:hypothetical protein